MDLLEFFRIHTRRRQMARWTVRLCEGKRAYGPWNGLGVLFQHLLNDSPPSSQRAGLVNRIVLCADVWVCRVFTGPPRAAGPGRAPAAAAEPGSREGRREEHPHLRPQWRGQVHAYPVHPSTRRGATGGCATPRVMRALYLCDRYDVSH
jgi:hypothetical protein